VNHRGEDISAALDAVLDGRATPEQERVLREASDADESIRAEVEAARRIESSLKRLFDAPTIGVPQDALDDAAVGAEGLSPIPISTVIPVSSMASISRVSAGTARGSRRAWWIAGTSAAAALAGTAYVLLPTGVKPSPVGSPGPVAARPTRTPESLYRMLHKRGFKPAFVCENDEQFDRFLTDRFGGSFLLASSAALEVVGWDYADGMVGEATAVVMTRFEGKEVVLLVDRAEEDRKPPAPCDGNSDGSSSGEKPETPLFMHRAEIGSLVVYEVSPFDQPAVLPKAYIPKR
jgi:hypothetical protein